MRRGSRAVVWSAVGIIATAAVVHLFDPVSGQYRRRRLRKHGMNVARRLGNGVTVGQLTRYGARRFSALASRVRDAAAHF